MRRIAARVRGVWLAAALAAPAAAQEAGDGRPVIDYGEGSNLIVLAPALLGPWETEQLGLFSASPDYFGAFAVDPGPGDFSYWVAGYQSQALAMEVAYQACRRDAAAAGGDCIIYARIEPQGYSMRLGAPIELGAPAARNWRDYYLARRDEGGYAAFALSGLASGAMVGAATQADADDEAMTACESAAADALRSLAVGGRESVRNSPLVDCEIVARHAAAGG
jgi:hypothetical protein